jgi:hypothetical protein
MGFAQDEQLLAAALAGDASSLRAALLAGASPACTGVVRARAALTDACTAACSHTPAGVPARRCAVCKLAR